MIRPADVALALWVAAWIAAGVVVASELRTLTQLSATVVRVGATASDAGAALGTLESLPLVGGELSGPADALKEAGDEAVRSGRQSAGSVRTASTIVGIALALVPSVPLLALYVPRRVRWERERRALERLLAAAGGDPRLEVWLARRALERLPLATVDRLVDEPWAGADAAEARALAAAELERYGIRR